MIQWLAWGEEAFARARETGRPLLLSLTATWCGACHRMDEETWEDPAVASVVERAAWLLVWQNFAKRFSERHGGGTPAMRLGIAARPIPIRELLQGRLFPTRVDLPAEWRRYYGGEVRTRRIVGERRHCLTLAT